MTVSSNPTTPEEYEALARKLEADAADDDKDGRHLLANRRRQAASEWRDRARARFGK